MITDTKQDIDLAPLGIDEPLVYWLPGPSRKIARMRRVK